MHPDRPLPPVAGHTGAPHGIEAGATETIVEVYGTAYEVEIIDDSGGLVYLGTVMMPTSGSHVSRN